MKETYGKLNKNTRIAVYIIIELIAIVLMYKTVVAMATYISWFGIIDGGLANLSFWLNLVGFVVGCFLMNTGYKLMDETNTFITNTKIAMIMVVLSKILMVISGIVFIYNIVVIFRFSGISIAILYAIVPSAIWEMLSLAVKSIMVIFAEKGISDDIKNGIV